MFERVWCDVQDEDFNEAVDERADDVDDDESLPKESKSLNWPKILKNDPGH